jgi:hypothetical protein
VTVFARLQVLNEVVPLCLWGSLGAVDQSDVVNHLVEDLVLLTATGKLSITVPYIMPVVHLVLYLQMRM